MLINNLKQSLTNQNLKPGYKNIWQAIHIDIWLFLLLLMLSALGLVVLYSASNSRAHAIEVQAFHLALSFVVLIITAQISPATLKRSAPWIYAISLSLLVTVLIMGHIGKGGRRWLNFGFFNFQPAELSKIAIPLLIAWYFHSRPLPIKLKSVLLLIPIILIPAILTIRQPDLGTGILLIISGISVFFLGGLNFRVLWLAALTLLPLLPAIWYALHEYQRKRVLVFFNPERDPLGSGYHIIQSKIAIGSGGVIGKGWLNGTQSNLHFLPEHTTDFIFAVFGEEFGFLGASLLITLYLLIVLRSFYITMNAQDTFTRLLAGSITCTFFTAFFINMGMVMGILPVVGIPLPLISYGGSSMLIIMASFGVLMSIQTHRTLVTS